MVLGLYLRVAWIFLLFNFGNCFPVDRSNNNTTPSSSSGSLKLPDVEYSEVSHPGNESSVEATSAAPEQTSTLESKDMDVPSDSNSTSDPGVLTPRTYGGFSQDTKDKMPVFSMQPQVVSSAGDSGAAPPSPWYGPQFFHEHMYAGERSHPYSYESGTVGFPHHNYAGSPPYDYSYDTPVSPNYNAYGSGESSSLSYGEPEYPPVSHGPTRSTSFYGFLAQQPPKIDSEIFPMNILMKLRQMPLAQVWRTSEVPLGKIEKNPFSHVVKSNRGYHRERNLRSNNWYSESSLF